MKRPLTPLLIAMMSLSLSAPHAAALPQTPDAGRFRLALERLATVGSVLYIAAHPDDENTRLLAWLVGDRKVRAAYVSLTRGDGGQNLVGDQLGEMLGVIRTHELLAARDLDGAEQFFTRAVDFGYSKRAAETLRKWGKEPVLADLVRVIRTLRPDVIISRFNTRPPNHGHHTASAILAREAFDAAADPSRFPEQLVGAGALRPHGAARLIENVSTWRMDKGADMSGFNAVDVGTYEPLAGVSWSEIAAASRTMHKSQGFGSAPKHGPVMEYFTPVAGSAPPAAPGSPLADLDMTWARFNGTERIRACIAKALTQYDPAHPDRLIPALVEVRQELAKLPADNPFKATKLAETDALLLAATGLVLDVRAKTAAITPDASLPVEVTALARAADGVKIQEIAWPYGATTRPALVLARHAPASVEHSLAIPADAPLSTPTWLRQPATGGIYSVADPAHGVIPDGPPDLPVTFTLDIGGARLSVTRPVRYVVTDRVRGEVSRRVEILPAVTATPMADVLMLPNDEEREIVVRFEAHADMVFTGRIEAPKGWRVDPRHATLQLDAGEAMELAYTVKPPRGAHQAATLRVLVELASGASSSWRKDVVDLPHLPQRSRVSPATVRAIPLSLKASAGKGGRRIGYIAGAGDAVAPSLRQVGYDVTVLDEAALMEADLSGYDAIIAGIRAYNVHPWLAQQRDRLFDYVDKGGRFIVQYTTSSRWRPLTIEVGPFPLSISRARVTDETAAMTPIDPKHPVLTTPNRLTDADFAGWVQERGLYFADTWDKRYTPVFSAHDEDEEPLKGGLLVAHHGKGVFAYTGISFFRQLPAGVPGAYRLLANLLVLGGK